MSSKILELLLAVRVTDLISGVVRSIPPSVVVAPSVATWPNLNWNYFTGLFDCLLGEGMILLCWMLPLPFLNRLTVLDVLLSSLLSLEFAPGTIAALFGS